jgi:hypothetical protein
MYIRIKEIDMRKCRELWPGQFNSPSVAMMKGDTGWRSLFAKAFFANDWETVMAIAPAVKEGARRAALTKRGVEATEVTVEFAIEVTNEWLKIAR